MANNDDRPNRPNLPLDGQLAAFGLPDDLPEAALQDAPVPDAAALARIKVMTFAKAGVVAVVPRPRNRLMNWGLVAAAVVLLAVAGVVGAVGPQRVWATFQRYVPGFGLVEEQVVKLSATQPVRMERGDAWVEVQGLAVTDSHVAVRVVSNRVPLAQNGISGDSLVSLEAERGKALKERSWSVSDDPDYPDAAGQFEFLGSIPSESRKVIVVIKGSPEWRLEIPLVPSDQLLSTEAFGPSAMAGGSTLPVPAAPSAKGTTPTVVTKTGSGGLVDQLQGEGSTPRIILGSYALSARVKPWAKRTAVTIIAQGTSGGYVEGLMEQGKEPAITLSAGNWKTIPKSSDGLKGGEQIWDFTADPLPAGTTSVTIRIPRLRVVEPGSATLRLKVADATLDETIQMGRWPVRLIRTEVANRRLTVWGDAGPGQTARDENGTHTDYLSLWGTVEGAGYGGTAGGGPQDPLYEGPKRENAQLMFVRFPVPTFSFSRLVSDTVTVTIRNPTVLVQGPWVITVPIEGNR